MALPALVIALIVGGVVYMVRGSATPVYESDIVAEVQTGAQVVVTDANLGQMVAPYIALSTDSAVVAEIEQKMGNGWAAADVSSHIAVTPGTSPALVFVKATGFSQEESDKLARVVVETLSDAQGQRNAETLDRRTKILTDDIARLNSQLAAARQKSIDNYETAKDDPTVAADLDARLEQLRQLRAAESNSDRLQLLSAPSGTGLPVAPKPFVESAVAFLVVLILVAEILVACRGRFSSRVTDAWARRTAKKFGASLLVQHSSVVEMPSNVALTLSQRASLGDHVLVLVGEGVDMNSWDVPEGLQARVSVHALSSNWWSVVDSSGTAFAIVVVSAQDADQSEIVSCLRTLAEVDVARSLVLVGPAAPEPVIDFLTLSSIRGRSGDTTPVSSPAVVGESAVGPLSAEDAPLYSNGVAEDLNRVTGAPSSSAEATSGLVVDSGDRRTRAGLIDAQTVTIDRRQLPALEPEDHSSPVEGPRTIVGAVGAGDLDGVDVVDHVDDINSEAATERIVLNTSKKGRTRDGRPVSRVGLLRHEGTRGTSKTD
ncbi:hypothetical protein [Rhodococcus sp. IEGM 1379]|uniref:hypothetical protein n=1 Tax=Rhodococcus sp. IEGM 1379 TaxID=3047086 RepID=UPI0024B663D4|nr:hypothetical protein [Rhodococcus sp. IEGM 1379]MDI9917080.1 hypothetical protein [Rhodococcus sp. IEGM 1379]